MAAALGAPKWFSDEGQSGVEPPHSTGCAPLNPCRSHAQAIRYKLVAQALPCYEEYLRLAPKGEFAEQTRKLMQRLKQVLTAVSK